MLQCDLCGADQPRLLLRPPKLDGPLVQCVRCGLRYVGSRRSHLTFGSEPPKVTAERLRHANIQFQHLRLEEEHRLSLLNARWRLGLIRKFLPEGRLLEVGCGRGDFLDIARESFQVYGVEPNPELAQAAERLAPIHCGVVESFPDGDFDVVATFHVIEHVDSPRRFMTALATRTKPGGFVVVETPNIRSLPFRLLRSSWRQFIPEHYYFFDPSTIQQLMEKSGFKTEHLIRIGKYASVDLILNRLSRYFRIPQTVQRLSRTLGVSQLTFRINPMDIMLVIARKTGPEP
jgi:2-polyprenyl-3-methyl-5-hydroxy-6-metoxy-1,4-benzoquinol methylase